MVYSGMVEGLQGITMQTYVVRYSQTGWVPLGARRLKPSKARSLLHRRAHSG